MSLILHFAQTSRPKADGLTAHGARSQLVMVHASDTLFRTGRVSHHVLCMGNLPEAVSLSTLNWSWVPKLSDSHARRVLDTLSAVAVRPEKNMPRGT